MSGNALIGARWIGRILVGIEENFRAQPIVYTMDRTGHYDRIIFGIPDVSYINLSDVAAGIDGAIAVSGTAYSIDGKAATFVARISPDRKQQMVTRVSPYVGEILAVAADGTIWTAGWVKAENGSISRTNILNRFDKAGHVLSSMTVLAKGRFTPGYGGVAASHLRASGDRVGWLTNSAEYIEFSLDGSVILRVVSPLQNEAYDHLTLSLALSEDSRVVLGAAGFGKWRLWVLNRTSRTWEPLQVSGGRLPIWGKLIGFDGFDLVVREAGNVTRRFKADLVVPSEKY